MGAGSEGQDLIHTDDRLSLKALNEKVVAEGFANETWSSVVERSFDIEYWPFIQSNQTRTCLNVVDANSP